jgi:hypothetical protein
MQNGAITGFAAPCCVSVAEFICVQNAAPLRSHYVVLIVKKRHSCGRFACVIAAFKAAMMIKRKRSFILVTEQLRVQESAGNRYISEPAYLSTVFTVYLTKTLSDDAV